MTPFLTYCERSHTGPEVSKDDWDFDHIVMKTKEVVDKYHLSWDSDTIIPTDAELLGSIFKAAKELAVATGLYNISTSRIVRFSAEEIDAGLLGMSKTLTMGEGNEAFTLVARGIEDPRPPAIWGGDPGCPTPGFLFAPIVESVAKEPVVDLLTCGCIIDIDGLEVRRSDWTETAAVVQEMQQVRHILEKLGRPGMGVLGAESSQTELGDLAAMRPDLLRPCDSHLIALFNELVIDDGNLVRAAAKEQYGVRNASLACTMVGGLGGDAPGATVLMAASMMAANLLCSADYHLCHPIHINQVSTTARGCLWLQSALCQTFAAHAPAIIVCDIWPKSGAGTKELLYETAANAIVATVSGGHLEGVGTVDGNVPNCSGLEVRLMGEVGKAVAKQRMGREQANEIVLKLLDKYEHIFDNPEGNRGKRFDEVYDLTTIEAKDEWRAMYEQVFDELVEMGIELERSV